MSDFETRLKEAAERSVLKLLPEAQEALCGAVGRLVAIADEFETRAELAEQNYVSAAEERDHLRAALATPAASVMTDAEIEAVIRANLGSGNMHNLIAIVRAAIDRAAKKEGGAV